MIGVNSYSHTFVASCPSDGSAIVYTLVVKSSRMLMVEHLITATSLIKTGFHEQIADLLHERFGGTQTIGAIHQGVFIETTRLDD